MEETLDNKDWESVNLLGNEIMADMLNHLKHIRDKKVWQYPTQDVIDFFNKPLPRHPASLTEVYADVRQQVMPFTSLNTHPRFWGWVMGNGTPAGMLAELISAAINVNMVGGIQSGSLVENQVMNWLKEIMGYPKDASGVLVSGCSMANFIGLSVALASCAGSNYGKTGLQNSDSRFCFYASNQTHSSISKAIKLLGIGTDYFRLVDVNENFEMDTGKLSEAIRNDRANGLTPCCVIGNAGTVNTGAIDNLPELSKICSREKIWFHVDGAIGAVLMMNTKLKDKLTGISNADSIAFDLHKWAHVQYEAGCCLVRNSKLHGDIFSTDSDYLEVTQRGLSGGEDWFCDYAIELSRGFKALKVWMAFRESGIEKIGRLMEQNIAQAQYLDALIRKEKNLEVLAPTSLNIVCFRFRMDDADKDILNSINEEIVLRIQEGGRFLTSYTRIKGMYALRVSITNHRTRKEDLFELVGEVKSVAEKLLKEKGM